MAAGINAAPINEYSLEREIERRKRLSVGSEDPHEPDNDYDDEMPI